MIRYKKKLWVKSSKLKFSVYLQNISWSNVFGKFFTIVLATPALAFFSELYSNKESHLCIKQDIPMIHRLRANHYDRNIQFYPKIQCKVCKRPFFQQEKAFLAKSKGQLVSKANFQAVNSSTKQMNEFIFTTIETNQNKVHVIYLWWLCITFVWPRGSKKQSHLPIVTLSDGILPCLDCA